MSSLAVFGFEMRSVGRGPNRDLLHTADTVAIAIAADLEVTVVTVARAPGVTQEVVVVAIVVSAVANSSDAMIKLGSAVVGGDHAALVVTELGRVGVDVDRGWALGNSGHQLVLVVRLDGVDRGNGDGAVVISPAILGLCNVRVVCFEADATVVKDVPHAVVFPATLAAE